MCRHDITSERVYSVNDGHATGEQETGNDQPECKEEK